MPTAIDTADEFLRLGRKAARAHDGIEIVKLCVIAQGWHLANTGAPLFGDRTEAWAYGPNIPTLHRALAHHGTCKIPVLTGTPSRLPEDAARHVARVYAAYGSLGRARLQALTTAPGTPWAEARAALPPNSEIPAETVRAHYLALRESRTPLAA